MKDFLSTKNPKYKRPEKNCREAIQTLESLSPKLVHKAKYCIGYPSNQSFNLEEFFKWWSQSDFSHYIFNEVGDPYGETSPHMNVRSLERQVLQYFCTLFHADYEESWGYLAAGGTLGNLQGIYLGREYLKKFGKPILYVSQEAHYSITSLAQVLDMDYQVIPAQVHGEIDYIDLEKQIKPERPALFTLSIGSTFKGAIDHVDKVHEIAKRKKVLRSYYHADAALFGPYLAYLQDPFSPKIDFQNSCIDSLSISGHKFYGMPIPTGVFLTRRKYIETKEKDYIDYIRSENYTIPCSRSTLSNLMLWWILNTSSLEIFQKEALSILTTSKYLQNQLLKKRINAQRTPFSNTIFFPSPSERLIEKWSLATARCPHLGKLAHIVVLPHISLDMIQEFIHDLDKETS